MTAVAPALVAFSSTAMFEEPAAVGGGGGYAYTGSPTSHGLTCASCHLAKVRGDGVEVWSLPAGVFERGFEPGVQYAILVELFREERGLERNGRCSSRGRGCNRNGFVAELLDPTTATPVGALCSDGGRRADEGPCAKPSGPTTALFSGARAVSGHSLAQPEVCGPDTVGDCVDLRPLRAAGGSKAEMDAALLKGVRGRTWWKFLWRAPGPSVSSATLWLALVDGDGRAAADGVHNDYFGDAVHVLQRRLWARGHEPASASPGGCSAAAAGPVSRAPHAWLTGLMVVAAMVLLRLRRVRT